MPKSCEEYSSEIGDKIIKTKEITDKQEKAIENDDEDAFEELENALIENENDIIEIAKESFTAKCEESDIKQAPNLCDDKKQVIGKIVIEGIFDEQTSGKRMAENIDFNKKVQSAIKDLFDTCK